MTAADERHPSHAADCFDLVALPVEAGPLHLTLALPGRRLLDRPDFPAAAAPASGRIASGRGLNADAAAASGLGEAIELVSCCAWGDEDLVSARAEDLGIAALWPTALNGLSGQQLAERDLWNRRYQDYDWRPRPFAERSLIDWLRVEDAFGGPEAYLPADFVFIGRRQAGDPQAVALGDSNGCASGPTPEAAKLAALLELIERDATGRWWYGRRRRPPIEPAQLPLPGTLLAWLAERPRRSLLFDITTDLGVPVLAAVSANPQGQEVAFGFAARLDWNAAAEAALTEMLQIERSLEISALLGEATGHWADWNRAVSLATPPLDAALREGGRRPPPVPIGCGKTMADLLAALQAGAVPLYFAEMTRAHFAVPVFRAVSTGLCHFKPRFDRPRLLQEDARDCASDRTAPGAQVPLLI